MNYIFLTNQYLPKPGATGLCMHQLAKSLVKDGNNVYTVCYEDGEIDREYDGVKIVKIHTPLYLKDNQSASNIRRKCQYWMSVFSKLLHIFQYPLRSNRLVFEYVKNIQKILKENGHSTIIASYTPLEAVVAATKIKKKYPKLVKIAYYSADTLSNEQSEDGILSMEYRRAAGIKWEKKLFKEYDKIFIMECHKSHYYSEVFSEFREKFALVNFPLLHRVENQETIREEHDNKVCLVYAGTLYQKLRNPNFLNAILISMSKEVNINAYFLGGGDCEEIMRKAEINSNGSIHYLGMKTHDVAKKYIASADVLLSIGNVESPMAPSKIYEYMSTGKPIIHTYTYDKDPCIVPLQKYGNALLLNETDDNAVNKIVEFVNNRRYIPYEEVEKIFVTSTPSYTTTILSEKLW